MPQGRKACMDFFLKGIICKNFYKKPYKSSFTAL